MEKHILIDFQRLSWSRWPQPSLHITINSFNRITQADCRETGEMIGSAFEYSVLIMVLITLQLWNS